MVLEKRLDIVSKFLRKKVFKQVGNREQRCVIVFDPT